MTTLKDHSKLFLKQEQEEVGLKLKAKGRQRFRLVSARRQTDGNLVGQVTLLHELVLGDPLDGIRLKSQDRTRINQLVSKDQNTTEGMDGGVEEDEERGGGRSFGPRRLQSSMGEEPQGRNSNIPVKRGRSHCQGMTRL